MASPPAPFVPRCGHCHSTTSLLRCSRCKVQNYCSTEHQAADFSAHKSACRGVRRSFEAMKVEEEKLRKKFANCDIDPFTNSDGESWVFDAAENYMEDCHYHLKQLARIETYHSTVAELNCGVGLVRLDRSDSRSLQHRIPYLMLRLDRDQEAYDFIKWWVSTTQESIDDGLDIHLGYQDFENSDCFEDVSYLCRDWVEPSLIAAAVLLKVKMLLDLVSLQASVAGKEIPVHVPAEIFNLIRHHSVRSPVIKANQGIMGSKDQKYDIDMLVKQVKKLCNAVHILNNHFWPVLLQPGPDLKAGLSNLTPSHLLEVQYVLTFARSAWKETRGSIEIIRAITKT